MKTISARITIGAPRSIARFNEYKTGNPLPICCDCLLVAPTEIAFKPLGLLNTPFAVKGICYACEQSALVAFCSAKTKSLTDHTKRGLLRHCIVSTD